MRFLAVCTALACFIGSVASRSDHASMSMYDQQHQNLLRAGRRSVVSSCASKMMDTSLPSNPPSGYNFSGVVRQYYVAAKYVEWNYAPSGWDNFVGLPLNESFLASKAGYTSSSTAVGIEKILKAHYIGYTDATFTTPTTQPEWLGLQGPIMRAELGDMVQVLLYNNMSDHYVSMHSMGAFYSTMSDDEDDVSTVSMGQAMLGGTMGVTAPGQCSVIKWLFPDSSAPASGSNSRLAFYHSAVNTYSDLNAGLAGPLIVYNRGTMASTMAQNKEFVLNYNYFDETMSFLAQTNVETYTPTLLNTTQPLQLQPASMITSQVNASVWLPKLTNSAPMLSSMATSALPVVTAINGYVLNNLPGLSMSVGDSVIWYLYNPGEMSHVAHWHGHNVMSNGEYKVVVSLTYGDAQTVTMMADNPGNWAVICHVLDHLNMGMLANYYVGNSTSTF